MAVAYDVLVGPLADAADRLIRIGGGQTLPLVTDARIFGLHGDRVRAILPVEPVLLPEGEAAKDWAVLAELLGHLTRMDIARDTPILAMGGGSVGDVAGLAASLFKRGCPIVHIPTTLLAQADSAIGGKTAIDWQGQKNLVGTFYQPSLVVADPAFLETLDLQQMRAGYAEVVKYGFIDDPAFFDWCEANGAALLAGDQALRQTAIEHCVGAKLRLVEGDLEDRLGTRALLNFGHTFGHAIEALAGFGPVLHGEAVGLGMALAFKLSTELGLCSKADTDRVIAHLSAVGLPTTLSEVGMTGRGDELVELMAHDKKADSKGLNLILVREIGAAIVSPAITLDQLRASVR